MSNFRKKTSQTTFQEWKNKLIIFTDNLTCALLGKDTIDNEQPKVSSIAVEEMKSEIRRMIQCHL